MDSLDRPTTVILRHSVIVVCVPAYNEERFLGEALESLRTQTWTDFAVLICDNASTDATPQIAQAMAARDARFHYHRHDRNLGGCGNFNFGRDATESPYLMWLGAHDAIMPTFLEKNIAALENDKGLSISAAYTRWIDEAGETIKETRGWMDRVPNVPILRYMLQTRTHDMCGEINNVIRRENLDGFRFSPTRGTDEVALAHLAYRGRISYVPESLYFRREIGHRSENYMKRLAGVKTEDRGSHDLIEGLTSHLNNIAKSDLLRVILYYPFYFWLKERNNLKTNLVADNMIKLCRRALGIAKKAIH